MSWSITQARSASNELAPRGIRSNAVAPGPILTPIIGTTCGIPPEQLDEFTECLLEPYGKLIPIGKPGRPKDIAEALSEFNARVGEIENKKVGWLPKHNG